VEFLGDPAHHEFMNEGAHKESDEHMAADVEKWEFDEK
jgi:hypothetical protein